MAQSPSHSSPGGYSLHSDFSTQGYGAKAAKALPGSPGYATTDGNDSLGYTASVTSAGQTQLLGHGNIRGNAAERAQPYGAPLRGAVGAADLVVPRPPGQKNLPPLPAKRAPAEAPFSDLVEFTPPAAGSST